MIMMLIGLEVASANQIKASTKQASEYCIDELKSRIDLSARPSTQRTEFTYRLDVLES